jgi:dolichyl-diphosphooligosaccharide--protein glycosyltransferase
MATTPTTTRGWTWEVAALGLVAVGVAIRWLPARFIFGPGGLTMPDTDPYYHLRRAQLLLEHGLSGATWDAWLSFPNGAAIPWPPGFDLLLALPALLGGEPSQVPYWAAGLIPCLGGLAIYLTYRVGRALADPPVGLAAAGFMALSLGAVHLSSVGRVDHHALVAPLVLGALLACLASMRARSTPGQLGLGTLSGLLAALGAFCWIVTPGLYFLPIPILLVAGSLRSPGWIPRATAWSIALSSSLMVLAATLLSADLARTPFALYQPSWLSLAPFGLWSFAILAARLGLRPLLCLGLGTGLALGAVLALAPEAAGPLLDAWRVAAGQDATYQIVRESDSVLMHAGLLNLQRAASLYSYLLLVWPAVLAWLLLRLVREPDRRPERLLLLVFTGLGCSLLMLQERFGEFGAPGLALLLAWGLVELGRAVRRRIAEAAEAAARRRLRVLAGLLALAVLAALSPLASGPMFLRQHDPVRHQRQLLEFGRELDRVLPPAEDGARPASGLWAGWTDAHALLWLTGRAVTTSSFGTPDAVRGNRMAFGWLLAAEEEPTARDMRSRGVLHLVVSQAIHQFEAMSAMADVPGPFVQRSLGYSGDVPFLEYSPLPAFARCLHSRLWLADGSQRTLGGLEFAPLTRFRLLFESRERTEMLGLGVPTFKAFELVAGARLVGQAEPEQEVRLRLALRTHTGRRFTYQQAGRADARGAWELVVPYATGAQGACHAEGPYRVRVGARVFHVGVAERAVTLGERVAVGELPQGATQERGAVE